MSNARVVSLASVFQEALTVVVRVRFHLQIVQDVEVFRTEIRQLLGSVMQRARALGYTNDAVQASVFAIVALLDESILNLQDSASTSWARRPLQEELFGGHLAGEAFFHNLRDYLSQTDSPPLADVLELHCLCLLLGYRGRYALGDSGEMHAMLQQARVRVVRIRGSSRLLPVKAVETPLAEPTQDRNLWSKRLLWTAGALASLLLILFVAYSLSLASEASALQSRTVVRSAQRAENLPGCMAAHSRALCTL